jgi:hypothetical protein
MSQSVSQSARLRSDYHQRETKDAQQMAVCSHVCERRNKQRIINQPIPGKKIIYEPFACHTYH